MKQIHREHDNLKDQDGNWFRNLILRCGIQIAVNAGVTW